MKNNTMRIALVLCLCIVTFAVWDKDKPSSSTSLRNSNPEMLANQSALETAFTQDHEFSTGGTNSGEHEQIKFNAPISTPTNAANKLFIYGKDVSSVIEAHILDESGNELQITSAGDLYSSAGLTVTTASTFNGSITLGAGDDLIGSATSDITFNTNKFTVAGATGNTVIAGTCDITGATEVTGIATLGDASTLKTSTAPTADAEIANKKYVDDQIIAKVALSAYTNQDSESNAMLKAHAYQAATDGQVTAYVQANTINQNLAGYVGLTNDPAGAGDLIQKVSSVSSFGVPLFAISFLVAKDEYFEITTPSTNAPTIRWKSFGTLSKPVDQD